MSSVSTIDNSHQEVSSSVLVTSTDNQVKIQASESVRQLLKVDYNLNWYDCVIDEEAKAVKVEVTSNVKVEAVEVAVLPDMRCRCIGCQKEFVHSGREQLFFAEKKWSTPVRCKPCQAAKKATNGGGGGGGGAAAPEAVDKHYNCKGCKKECVHDVREQLFFATKGWSTPVRCKPCQAAKKANNGGK